MLLAESFNLFCTFWTFEPLWFSVWSLQTLCTCMKEHVKNKAFKLKNIIENHRVVYLV